MEILVTLVVSVIGTVLANILTDLYRDWSDQYNRKQLELPAAEITDFDNSDTEVESIITHPGRNDSGSDTVHHTDPT